MDSLTESRPQPDEQLDTIARSARRQLLIALLDGRTDTPIRIDEHLAATDSEETLATMRHVHLPKLEERGFVRWDREGHLVTRGPQFPEIEPLLTLLYDHRDELPDEWL